MARVIDPDGVDLGEVTDLGALFYYRREPGFVVDGVTVGDEPAPVVDPADVVVSDGDVPAATGRGKGKAAETTGP